MPVNSKRRIFGRKERLLQYDLVAHIKDQMEWSIDTFGPSEERGSEGVIDHLRKEIEEVAKSPDDITEWIDIMILAIDGAWRSGFDPDQIATALFDKMKVNEKRDWPDWRKAEKGKAIEHIRDKDKGRS